MQSTALLKALEETGFTGGQPVACYAVVDASGELLFVSQLPGRDRALVALDEDGATIRDCERVRELEEALRNLEEVEGVPS